MQNFFTIALFTIAFTFNSFADHGPRSQFIHNIPAEAAATVDIWATYGQVGFYPPYKIYDGVNYKEATEFLTYGLIYGDLTFYVTPAGSIDTSNYFFKNTFGQPQIDYDETFVIVLTGNNPDNFRIGIGAVIKAE